MIQVAIICEDEDAKAKEYPVPFFRAGDVVFIDASVALKFILKSDELAGRISVFGDAHARIIEPNEVYNAMLNEDATRSALDLLPEGLKSASSKTTNVKEGCAYEYDWSKARLPEEGKRNVLITAALPYVNNVPHLGNVIGAVLSADVYARYCRQRGQQVVYICGTDEYGTATETKALEEKVSCQDLCAKYFKLHASVYDWFQIRFDHFGRTWNPFQTGITHEIFQDLYDNGFFFEDAVEQTFCETCDRFLADRFVEGTCPLCGFTDARGDQCDGCGKLLNSTELKAPKCKLCKSTPVVRSSRHLFLDLTKLQPQTEAWVEAASKRGSWSSNSTAIAKAWLTEGLRPRCMTRDLKWGTSVPVPGFEDKVFYVWFDAPIGYISITADYLRGAGPWERWWKNPGGVELVQFMGKDNVPFHTVIFPSTLLGTGQPWTMLHHISTTEYLNYEAGKFSKSRGTGVFGNGARDSGIPAAVWRYYLLATRPETTDASFAWDDFGAKTNAELLANLGNLVSRTAKFLFAKLEGRLGRQCHDAVDAELIARVNAGLGAYTEAMDRVQLRAGLKEVMAISALGNAYLVEAKLDGKLLAADPERCRSVLSLALNLVYLLSALLEPFLPSTAADIARILRAPALRIPKAAWDPEVLLAGHEIDEPFHLFHRIDEAHLQQLRKQFAGKSAEATPKPAKKQ
jgi:methionyl-tRNA synthetase